MPGFSAGEHGFTPPEAFRSVSSGDGENTGNDEEPGVSPEELAAMVAEERERIRGRREKARERIGNVLTPHFLDLLAQAGGARFVFRPNPEPRPGSSNWATIPGETQGERIIFYNEEHLDEGGPEAKADWYVRSVLYHEAGHHAPMVEELQKKFGKEKREKPYVPEFLENNNWLHSTAHNGLADVWLEEYMGRGRYKTIKHDIVRRNKEDGNHSAEEIMAMFQSQATDPRTRDIIGKHFLTRMAQLARREHKLEGPDALTHVEQELNLAPGSLSTKDGFESAVERVRLALETNHQAPDEPVNAAVRRAVIGSHLKLMPRTEQLTQLLLSDGRYPASIPLADRVLPDVAEAFQKMMKTRAMKTIMDTTAFDSPLTPEEVLRAEVEEKYRQYVAHIRPRFVELMRADVQDAIQEEEERRKQEGDQDENKGEKGDKGEEGQGESQGEKGDKGEEGEEGQGESQGQGEGQEGEEQGEQQEGSGTSKPGQPGEDQPGEGQPGDEVKSGKESGKEGEKDKHKLTPEEARELAREIANELEVAGERRESKTDVDAAKKGRQEGDAKRKAAAREAKDGQQPGSNNPEGKGEQEGTSQEEPKPTKDEAERRREIGKSLGRDTDRRRQEQTAERMGVKPEAIKALDRYRDRNREIIERLAQRIADALKTDRRSRMEYTARYGEITPGLETEYLAAVESGDPEPRLHMNTEGEPRFAQVEVMFFIDLSASMGDAKSVNSKLEMSISSLINFMEGFRKAQDELEGEQLLASPDERPLKLGAIGFTSETVPVLPLTGDIDDRIVANTIHILQTAESGGTDETKTLTEGFGQMSLKEKRIIKIGVVLTDGSGNAEQTSILMNQLESDEDVIVFVLALDGNGDDLRGSYSTPRTGTAASRIFILEATSPRQIAAKLEDAFATQIPRRIEELLTDETGMPRT